MSYCSACGGWKGTVHTCSGNMQVDTSSNSSQKNQTKGDKYMIDPKFKTELDGFNITLVLLPILFFFSYFIFS
ncbi:hypothetical protein RIR_jg23535.t1 [Rhizophagus irregularis DAOM 181602=DAOM 197198]|nr:hypothetical protein RIR_jg23535.t1 [Rhizophagus irregularis DAOM 181602=DAOM 197198]